MKTYHLAPMDKITDVAFRKTITETTEIPLYTYSEMISAERILNNYESCKRDMMKSDHEKNFSIQLFSPSSKNMINAIKIIEKKEDFRFINLNFGCPSKDIIRNKAGSYWLKFPKKIIRLTKEINKFNNNLTIKIRLGFNNINTSYLKEVISKYIIVHGRTAKQGYSGEANWEEIIKIKHNTGKTIIGNGDIFDYETAEKRIKLVDGIMIGRGALLNPFIFREIEKRKKTKQKEKIALFKRYFKNFERYDLNFGTLKTNSMIFIKGLRNTKWAKEKLQKSRSIEDINEIFDEIEHRLSEID